MNDYAKQPRQALSKRAWDEGRAARGAGQPRDACPYHPDQRPQARAWEGGWSSLGPLTNVHVAVPPGVRVRVEASIGAHFVPADEDIAQLQVYRPPSVPPCPCCRRKTLDSGSQAAVYSSSLPGQDVAWFLCRGCGARFKVPRVRQGP